MRRSTLSARTKQNNTRQIWRDELPISVNLVMGSLLKVPLSALSASATPDEIWARCTGASRPIQTSKDQAHQDQENTLPPPRLWVLIPGDTGYTAYNLPR